MKAFKSILFLALGVLAVEYALFLYASSLSSEEKYVFQFAARYSGRFSFFIFVSLFTWVATIGLNEIYRKEGAKHVFILGSSLFAFNHILHFGLLYRAHELLGWELFTMRTIGGAIGYLVLILLPLILWKKKHLTKRLYWGIVSCFVYLEIIFFVSYFGRWNKETIYKPDSKEFFIGCLMIALLLFGINSYRIIREQLGKS